MRVLNIMLSEGRGGIEAAFGNYTVALKAAGCDVACVVTPGAAMSDALGDTRVIPLPNRSQFDPFALWRASRLLKQEKPDVLVAHGRRAYLIFLLAQTLFGKHAPLVQVLHRPRFKQLKEADHTITVSQQLAAQAIAQGATASRVTYIPNFLPCMPDAVPARPFAQPPVIGVLGRMVEVKGLDLFLEALALLKKDGVAFRAHIGGSGALETELKAHAARLGLEQELTWLGWVEETDAFYRGIDVFCLPSRAESFGLVVIEAFAQGKLVVSTRTSGPSELIVDGQNGLLCDITPESITAALTRALKEPVAAMVAQGMLDKDTYSLDTVAPQIAACLRSVISSFAASGGRGAQH